MSVPEAIVWFYIYMFKQMSMTYLYVLGAAGVYLGVSLYRLVRQRFRKQASQG